jgi:hypothetical protein
MALRDALENLNPDHRLSVRRLKHPANAGHAASSRDRPAALHHVELEAQRAPVVPSPHGPRRAEPLLAWPVHHQPVRAQRVLLRGAGVHLLPVQLALLLPPESVANDLRNRCMWHSALRSSSTMFSKGWPPMYFAYLAVTRLLLPLRLQLCLLRLWRSGGDQS